MRRIAAAMKDAGIDGLIYAGVDLSYEDERIVTMTPDEALVSEYSGMVTAYITNNAPKARPLIPVIRDSDMIRGDVPMTKECIRHESIIRLGLCEGEVMYDVGGGTGSVSIEAASLSPELKVYVIERKAEAVDLIRENIKKAGLGNIEVVEGEAPDAFEGLPSPDRVFIGGSGGRLSEIIGTLSGRKKGITYVINAVSLETCDEVRKLFSEYGIQDEEILQISVTGVRKAGEHHLMNAQNPVWIFTFKL